MCSLQLAPFDLTVVWKLHYEVLLDQASGASIGAAIHDLELF